jgi:hypothetical protein
LDSTPVAGPQPPRPIGLPLEPEQINELVVGALLDQYRRRLPLSPDRWPLGLASSSNRPLIDAVLERARIADESALHFAVFSPAGLKSQFKFHIRFNISPVPDV